MAVHWQIPFKALRTGALYTVSIYDSSYTGSPVVLKGGASPFTTQEDDDDDMFTPIRTQTGYVRIVDDGKDAAGNSLSNGWWQSMVPLTDTSRPVVLTKTVGSTTTVEWIGYLQAQDFSGTLYGDPQEREFPVHCVMDALKSIQLSTEEIYFGNFAGLLQKVLQWMPSPDNEFGINMIYVQGNTDAQQWLLKKLDWQNFYDMQGENIEPKYSVYEILEDTCRYWGWTARIQGRTLYLVRPDDADEPTFFRMNLTQLGTMAGGTASGQTGYAFEPVTLTGDIFASDDNTDYRVRGYSKATVKVDVNDQNSIISFAPGSVEKIMDAAGSYTWVDGEDTDTGYFTTPLIRTFDTATMAGQATQYGGFCRRQIYSDAESDSPTKEDMFVFLTGYTVGDNVVSIRTNKPMAYTGGSLKIKGDVFVGAVPWTWSDENDWIYFRVGIGMDRASAKWFYLNASSTTITHGWGSTPQTLRSVVKANRFNGIALVVNLVVTTAAIRQYPAIPCDTNLYGYLFFDFLGMANDHHDTEHFEIGNIEVEFTRDEIYFPSNSAQPRPRTMSEDRLTTREYTTVNSNASGGEWNADCIFASDDNMEYGLGLLMNPDGTFMATAPYNNVDKHPEQQLADRVAAYWEDSKREIDADLRTDIIGTITPRSKATLDGTTFYPAAIARDWRDDITTIKFLEL
jgi:hypothetical protein